MRTAFLLLALAVGLGRFGGGSASFAQGTVDFIPTGSVYRYLANGLDGGQTWWGTNFNDSNWPTGMAPLGYGQSGLGTIIAFGTNAANKHITSYFRHAFALAPNNPPPTNLLVRLRRDDGAIVYLNGLEIFRSNMPTGRVDYLTLATSEAVGVDETNYFASHVISGSLFVPPPGTNVLAAEVHLASSASPDLVFCSELTGNVPLPASLTLLLPAGFTTIANNYNVGGNTLNELLPQVADGTILYKWNPAIQNYDSFAYDAFAGAWSPNTTLPPGEGAWLYRPGPQTINFGGSQPKPPTARQRPASGLRFVSCRWPVAGTFEDVMGFPPINGDHVLFYDGTFQSLPQQATSTNIFINGAWSPSPPLLQPGKSAFVSLAPPINNPPTISMPNDFAMQVNSSTNVPFTVGDVETAATNLFVFGSSTNQTLVSNASLVFGGFGSNRTVQITPATNQTGTTRITLQVVDGGGSLAAAGFQVTVTNFSPLTLNCSSNKMFPCGASWTFDPPTPSGGCCSNTPVIVLTGFTNVSPCFSTFTRVWQATDCCSNSVTCTQTVSVVDFIPPAFSFCPSNKIVTCDSNWSFDSPVAFDTCCPSNPVVTILGTTTVGTCPQLITRTWLATDCCGNTNTCSQTVTVTDNTPPVLACVSNKTVECGTAWTFDAPNASDACCSSNVLINVVDTITNSFFPLVVSRTWQATDCCNNTSSPCSQTVTVLGNCGTNGCSGNLLVNGSFESPGLPDEYAYIAGESTFITGWKTVLNGVEYFDPRSARPEVMRVGVAADGIYAVDLGVLSFVGGGIEQTFPTLPNRQYHVSFKMGTEQFLGTDGTASLTVETEEMPPQTFYTINYGPMLGWSLKRFTFRTPPDGGTETTLRFATSDDGDTNAVNLDDVRVTDCCVELICPPKVIAECQTPNGAPVAWTVIATNHCSSNLTVTCTPPPGSWFPPGTNYVTCTATGDGVTQSCTFPVIVSGLCGGLCEENLLQNGSFEQPSREDGWLPIPSGSAPALLPGWTVLPAGVEYYDGTSLHPAVREAGAAPDGSFAVDLAYFTSTNGGGLEQYAPTIPGETYRLTFRAGTLERDGRLGTGRLEVTAGSNLLGFDLENHNNHTRWDGYEFFFRAESASTLVKFTTSDNAFLHYVELDNVRLARCPTNECVSITCPSNIVVSCQGSNGAFVSFTAIATNRCDPTNLVVTYSRLPGSFFPLGTTPVTCIAIGSRQTNQCSFAVTVLSNCPSSDCVGTNLLVNGSFEQPTIPDFYWQTTGDDLLITGWRTLGNGVEYHSWLASGTVYPVASEAIAHGLYAIDLASANGPGGIEQTFPTVIGRTYTVSFYLGTVKERGRNGFASVHVTAADVVRYFSMENDGSRTFFTRHSFSFSATASTTTLAFSTTNDPALAFVELDDVMVTDCCIEFACPADLTVPCQSTNGAIVSYSMSATNHCDPTNLFVFCDPPSGSLFPLGTSVATCWVIGSGQTNQCSFTVTVLSNCQPPLSVALVSTGSVWRYFDNGTDLGTAWRLPGFDDGGWLKGPAQLGFGGGDERTVLAPGHITYYFRQAFTVNNPAEFESLNVNLKRDDGAIVYLNGIEIFRSNMPTGTVNYLTPASLPVPRSDPWVTNLVSAGLLTSGTNVIAVEVHQHDLFGSDLGFDLGIIPTLVPCVVWSGPSSLVWPCEGPDGAHVIYNITATDPCGHYPVTLTFDPPSGSLFPKGTSEVVATATVNGHTVVRRIPVTVLDDCNRECLEVHCPSFIVAPCTNANGTPVFYGLSEITAMNHCNPADVTITFNPPSGTPFNLGETPVECIVTGSGQTMRCAFTVRVFPQPPLITYIVIDGHVMRILWRQDCREFEPEESPFLTDPLPGSPTPWRRVDAPIMKNGNERYVDVPIDPNSPTKFFRLRSVEPGDLQVAFDQIAIVAAEGVPAGNLAPLAQAHNLQLIRELPGNTFLFALSQATNHAALETLVQTIRQQYPQLVKQAGLVVTPAGAAMPMILTDELIVQFHQNVDRAAIDALNATHSVQIVFENQFWKNHFLLRTTAASAADAMELSRRYGQHALVQYSEPNYVMFREFRAMIPNDPLFGNQWHLNNTGQGGGTPDADIDAPEAWDITTGSAGIMIAVLDGGFDVTHPDLVPNLWVNPGEIPGNGLDDDGNMFRDDINGWDFGGNDNNLAGDPHGTSVAGCAGARGNNLLGVSGSCPNCRLMLIRVPMNPTVMGDSLAFDYARAKDADIITCSWGYDIGTPLTVSVVDAINRAATTGRGGLGCVVLFAMNNSNRDDCLGLPGPGQPDVSTLANVIAVSAASNQDRKVTESAWGNCMDVLAPTHRGFGVVPFTGTLNIITTDIAGNGGYNNTTAPAAPCPGETGDRNYTACFGGTSAATPITAGIAGLILSVNPALTREQIQRLLQDTADKIEDSRGAYSATTGFSSPPTGIATHGYGRVNAFEAVRVAAPVANDGLGGVDVFLRDNRLDWGNTEQPSYVLFEPTRGFIPHWQSLDIKVDAPPFLPAAPTTSAEFEAFADENAVAETVNRVYVRVHNRGPITAGEVLVKLHWSFAGTGLPALPADFWPSFPGDSPDTTRWHPLGTRTITALAYSGTSVAGSADDRAQVVQFDFPAPAIDPVAPDPRHHCLFAVIESSQDVVSPTSRASLVPDHITPTDNNVTHKNVSLQDPTGGGIRTERIYVHNPFDTSILTRLRVDAPTNWPVMVAPVGFDTAFVLAPQAEQLLTVSIGVLDPGYNGTITIFQERLDSQPEYILGGFTFKFVAP